MRGNEVVRNCAFFAMTLESSSTYYPLEAGRLAQTSNKARDNCLDIMVAEMLQVNLLFVFSCELGVKCEVEANYRLCLVTNDQEEPKRTV